MDLQYLTNGLPIPSSKKQVILTELNLQYLTNGLTTLVKTKGALVSPNGKIGKTKNFVLPLNTLENRRNFCVRKYQDGDNRSLDQI